MKCQGCGEDFPKEELKVEMVTGWILCNDCLVEFTSQ